MPWDGEGAMTALRAGKGRSLSFLASWARHGLTLPEGEDYKGAHFAASKEAGKVLDVLDGTGELRMNTRTYIETNDVFKDLRAKERQPREGEPLEPPGRF